ncbi:MAG: LPS-assembly protein LptD, partial [Burkholderiaceae bacterium]|nr:LPS-assembly protein LptD [Burkholderiaceae bacterium]
LTTLNRQEVGTGFTGLKNWNINMRALTFQTLQPDPTAISNAPYNILPQITANYSNRLNFSDKPKSSSKSGTQNLAESSQNKSAQGMQAFLSPVVALGLEFSRFSYNANTSYGPASGLSQGGTFSQADRAVLKGSISNPLVTPGYFLRPKLSIQANNYSGTLVNGIAGSNQIKQPNPSIQGFAIPTVSLDSGLAFERDATEMKSFFGRDMVLTIEPRAFYVFTPFQNQAQTPLFDTADAGFGISQIFSENTFVGNDRVADNNKLTMGLTSRMVETNSGAERAMFTLAQRQDFTGQRVGLNGTIQNPTRYSDTLGATTIRLMGNFNMDLFGQYNTQLNRFVQNSIGTSWKPTPGRTLNFSYRNVWNPPTGGNNSGVTQTDQYNVFGEWPAFKKYRLLGRWGYDALTAKTLNTLFGLQYDEDCWTARLAYAQVRNTSQLTTTQVLFQLEFRGFASVGNNPVDVMRLNVPGYQPMVKPLPPSSFENYQ